MTGARTRRARRDGAGRRFGAALAAALLVAGAVACDARAPSEPAPPAANAPARDASPGAETPDAETPGSETPGAELPEPMPPEGQIRLRVDGSKITLHASAAPRRTLLEMLAHELDFALIAPRLGNGPVTIRADAKTLPEILPLLLANRPYRAEYRIDVVDGRHALEQLEVGPPGGDAFALDEILPPPPSETPDADAVVAMPEDAAQVDWKKLLLRLDDADAEERIEALAEIDADGEGLALITDRLARDPDPGVRAAAAEQLEFADTLAAVDALVLALGDPDRRVVLAAIDALELTEDTTVVEDLVPLLDHPDPEIREAAQEAIEFIRPDTDDDV